MEESFECFNHGERGRRGRDCIGSSGSVRPAPFDSSGGDLCDSCSEGDSTLFSSVGCNSAAGQRSTAPTESSYSVSNADGDSLNKILRKKHRRHCRSTGDIETANKSGRSSIHHTEAIPTSKRRHNRRRNKNSTRFHFLNVKECGRIEDAIQLTCGHGRLSPKNLAAFWSHLAHLMPSECKNPRPIQNQQEVKIKMKDILEATMDQVNNFPPKDLSGAVLGMAKAVKHARAARVGRTPCQIQEMFQEILLDSGSIPREDVFQAVARSAQTITKFDARDLSNLAYAYAIVDYLPILDGGGTLFSQIIERHALMRLESFNSQGLSNLVWSCAKLGVSSSRLFNGVAGALMERDFSTFNPQDLSNTIWAYAVTGNSTPGLLEKVAAAVLARDLGAFDPQHLSMIVWSFSVAGELSPCLSQKVAAVIIESDLNTFGHEALCKIVWSFATSGRPCPHLFDIIADFITARDLVSFSPQSLSTIVWAYATTGRSNVRLLVRLHQLFTKVANSIIARDLRTFKPQDLSRIAWAFAVSDVAAPDLFGDRFIAALSENLGEFKKNGLIQIHQWRLWQLELKSNVCLPPSLEVLCRETFISQCTYPSHHRNDVVCELSAIGLQPRAEVLMPSGYRVDALVEVNGEVVGVDADGPVDFILGGEPTAKTSLKRRQVLSIDGVRIVSVPHWEWITLGSSINKQQYLCSMLRIQNFAGYPVHYSCDPSMHCYVNNPGMYH